METVEKYSVKGKVIAILRNTNMVIYYWLRSRIGKDRAKRIAMFVCKILTWGDLISMKKIILVCGTAKGIPMWMYYVKYLLCLLESIINLFTLPFHKQIDISLGWMARMMLRPRIKHLQRMERNRGRQAE